MVRLVLKVRQESGLRSRADNTYEDENGETPCMCV